MPKPYQMGPRTAEYVQLRDRGLTSGQIAKKMGLQVGSIARMARCALAHAEGRVGMNTGRPVGKFTFEDRVPTRCKCGLFLPHECLPTIYQLATSRNGESTGLSE